MGEREEGMKTYRYKVLRGCCIAASDDYMLTVQRNQWGPGGRGYEGLFGMRLATNGRKEDANEGGGPTKGRAGEGEGVAMPSRSVQQD